MDVTCERCGTEYEFDETLVSDRGTTVKCTNCGHLFKVFRRGAEPSRGDESAKIWQLRMASGETQAFGSLKELQRLIAEGKVSEDDKLARAGEGWKRLGDIAELSTFFAAARPAKKAPAPPPGPAPKPPAGKGTMMGMGGARREAADYQPAATLQSAVPPPAAPAPPRPKPTPPSAPAPAAPPARPAPAPAEPARRPAARTDQTMKGIGSGGRQSYEEIGSSDAISEPAIPPPPRTPSPPAARAVDSEPPPPPPKRRREEERRPDSRRPPAVRPLQLDDDEAPVPPPRRNLTPVWLGLFVLALVGGGLFWAWPMIQGGGGGETATPASPADRFITAGEEALARDRLATYDDAADEFTKALAVDEASVRAQVGLARAHALQAQARLFEADDIEARAGEDAALRGEATALRRTAAEEAAEARTAAEAAVRAGTGGADAELVLADALRLVGERDLAQSRLGRAQTLSPGPNAEALRVQALLSAPAGAAGLASARDLAAQAVAADGNLLRARLLLARASLAAGDGEAARREAEAVLAHDGTHADALGLRDRAMALINAGGGTPVAPPATSVGTVPPTTTTPVVVPPATSTPTIAPPTTTTPAGEGGGGGSTAPQGRDYSSLVREGEARLERGQTAGARQSFEAALRSRSGGAEALTGLGYVMLNEGNAAGAVRQFSTAAANGNGDALIGLGDAHRRLGQREQALEAYRRYLQILPSGSHASVARRQIDQLGGGSSGGGTHPSGGSTGGGSGGSQETGSGSEGGSGSGSGSGSEAGSGGEAGSGTSHHLETPPTVTDTPAIESEP